MKTAKELVFEVIKEMQEEITRRRDTIKSSKELLLPVLTILEEEDIPVEKVWWTLYTKEVELKEWAALTKEAAQRIVGLIGKEPAMEVKKDGLTWTFGETYSRNWIRIANGKGTCKIRRVTKLVEVPHRVEERHTYVLDGECSSAMIMEEETNGSTGQD